MAGLSWRQLVKCLKSLGFEGPIKVGGKHPWAMTRNGQIYKIPTDHGTDIGDTLLSIVRKQMQISKEECQPT